MTFVVSDQCRGSRLKVTKLSLVWRSWFFSWVLPFHHPHILQLTNRYQSPLACNHPLVRGQKVLSWKQETRGDIYTSTETSRYSLTRKPTQIPTTPCLNFDSLGEVQSDKSSVAFLCNSTLQSWTCQQHCPQSGWWPSSWEFWTQRWSWKEDPGWASQERIKQLTNPLSK